MLKRVKFRSSLIVGNEFNQHEYGIASTPTPTNTYTQLNSLVIIPSFGCNIYILYMCSRCSLHAKKHIHERTNRHRYTVHIYSQSDRRMCAQAHTQKTVRSKSFGSQELNCTNGSFKKKMKKFLFHFIDHSVVAIRLA